MDDRSERLCNGKLKVEHVHVPAEAAASFTADLGEAAFLVLVLVQSRSGEAARRFPGFGTQAPTRFVYSV